MSRAVEPLVRPDPLEDPYVLVVKSASKPGKWHRVKWWLDRHRDLHVECDSGFCERDMYKPSEECRHEREARLYIDADSLEEQLAKSIAMVQARKAEPPEPEQYQYEDDCPECLCSPCECDANAAAFAERRAAWEAENYDPFAYEVVR